MKQENGILHSFETNSVHAGQVIDPATLARATPIYASSSFCFKSAEHARKLFNLEEFGEIYGRVGNPTNDVFEKRIAALEGGLMALSTSSGLSATFTTILTLCEAGDNIVSSVNLYGGVFQQFKVTFPRLGVKVRFADNHGTKPEDFAAYIDDNTRGIYVESLGNPRYSVPDIEALAELAHSNGIPLIVDNTFGMGGFVCQPIKHGADIVLHSATKWIGGHGTTMGGVIVDAGTGPWMSGKHPLFSTPCPAYDGMKFGEAFGPDSKFGNIAFIIRARVEVMRDIGVCQSPFSSFLLLQGLETLPLRAERHCENTNKVARWLDAHDLVAWVNHVGFASHDSHAMAKRYFRDGCYGGALCFGVQGGHTAGVKFIESVKLASHLANIGDAKTLVIHPASTTHGQLEATEKIAAGAPPDAIRVSIGIEGVEDIISDFEQALVKAHDIQ